MPRPTDSEILDVYRQTIGPLYSAVSRKCGGDRTVTEDVVQETWLRAVEAWRRQGMPDVPAAWLTAVARNLLLNEFRRKRPVALEAIGAEPVAVESTVDAEAAEAEAVIQRGLAGIPVAEAGVLNAFHLQEQPVATIASELRISERAVEGRLRRARIKLRDAIKRRLT
jgi:RNA polymerase sigma-70 factor (ECF subfamily)